MCDVSFFLVILQTWSVENAMEAFMTWGWPSGWEGYVYVTEIKWKTNNSNNIDKTIVAN